MPLSLQRNRRPSLTRASAPSERTGSLHRPPWVPLPANPVARRCSALPGCSIPIRQTRDRAPSTGEADGASAQLQVELPVDAACQCIDAGHAAGDADEDQFLPAVLSLTDAGRARPTEGGRARNCQRVFPVLRSTAIRKLMPASVDFSFGSNLRSSWSFARTTRSSARTGERPLAPCPTNGPSLPPHFTAVQIQVQQDDLFG